MQIFGLVYSVQLNVLQPDKEHAVNPDGTVYLHNIASYFPVAFVAMESIRLVY